MESGYVSGCNDYIVKPIDRFERLAKVRTFLDE
jgi:DNA-binding response OmpR family regulator